MNVGGMRKLEGDGSGSREVQKRGRKNGNAEAERGKKIFEKGGQRKNLGMGENGNEDPPGHPYKYTVK